MRKVLAPELGVVDLEAVKELRLVLERHARVVEDGVHHGDERLLGGDGLLLAELITRHALAVRRLCVSQTSISVNL